MINQSMKEFRDLEGGIKLHSLNLEPKEIAQRECSYHLCESIIIDLYEDFRWFSKGKILIFIKRS